MATPGSGGTPTDGDDAPGMGPRAASAEGLEVNWATVDPAALASLEMALAFGAKADGPLAVAAAEAHEEARARGDHAVREAAAFADVDATAAYLDRQMAQVEQQLAAATATLDEAVPSSSSSDGDDDGVANDNAGAAAPGADDTVAATGDVDEEEEEGMGAPLGTAEASWGGEETAGEWVLERIVRRRYNRGAIGSFDADVDAEDMRWEYLCVWQGYAETTWERRAFLQDCGFGDRVAEHDRNAAPAKPSSTKRHRPKKPATGGVSAKTRRREARELAQQEAKRLREERERLKRLSEQAKSALLSFGACVDSIVYCSQKLRNAAAWRTVVEHLYTHGQASSTAMAGPQSQADVEALMTTSDNEPRGTERGVARLLHAVASQFGDCGGVFSNYLVKTIHVIDPGTLDGLARRLRQSRDATVRVVFHGTRQAAVGPITKQGLLVPRPEINGVRVTNGSVHGIGIYTSDNIGTPAGYMHGSNKMFVCIGLSNTGSNVVTELGNGFHIYGEDDAVAPVLQLDVEYIYATRCEEKAIARYTNTTLTAFKTPDVQAY